MRLEENARHREVYKNRRRNKEKERQEEVDTNWRRNKEKGSQEEVDKIEEETKRWRKMKK